MSDDTTHNNTRTSGKPAHLGFRLAAFVYDLFPLIALAMLTSAIWLLLLGGQPVTPGSPTAYAQLASILIVCAAYFALSIRYGGQTIGMRAWRLRVVDEHGEQPDWPTTIKRTGVGFASLLVGGLGFVWSLFEPKRRTWHDLATQTLVLRLDKQKKARKKKP